MKSIVYKSIFILVSFLFLSSFVWAQTEREKGIELYKQGKYNEAVKLFEKAKKDNPQDFDTVFFLGMALLNQNKLKQAESAFQEASYINPKDAKTLTALSFVLIQRGNYKRAIAEAEKAILLDKTDAESYYVIGMGKAKSGELEAALENAEQAVKLKPSLAAPYLLKSQILIRLLQNEKPYKNISEFSKKYGSAGDNFVKFASLVKNKTDITQGQQEAFEFFTNYYEKKKKLSAGANNPSVKNEKPIKILKKPRPSYTEQARQAGVSGRIILLVAFAETGKIDHVIVLSGLGYGLDEATIKAAKAITFEPEEIDGKPVLSVKMLEYSFSIY